MVIASNDPYITKVWAKFGDSDATAGQTIHLDRQVSRPSPPGFKLTDPPFRAEA
jgi:hypothetical protein